MKKNRYKILLAWNLVLLIIGLYLNTSEIKIELFQKQSWLVYLIDYSPPILSLCLLYLSIFIYFIKSYSYKFFDNPILLVILASILTIYSFAIPFKNYYASVKILDEADIQTSSWQYADTARYNENLTYKQRLLSAKQYYIVTGEKIEFLDDKSNKTHFTPTNGDIDERREYEQNRKNISNMVRFTKTKIYHLLSFSVLSMIGFIVFLQLKISKMQEK